jgi:hypothetical protein
MNLEKLMKMLAPYAGIDEDDVQVYDLSTDEGLKGYNEQLDQLENASLDVLNSFGINGKEWIKSMRNLGKKIHEQNKKQEEKQEENKIKKSRSLIHEAVKQMKRKEEDHSDEPEEDENPKVTFVRPSQRLTVPQKLQLHKIVQEYVDTMIKPYNDGHLTNGQINDAYAGLYEFAAWIMNK